MFPDVSVIEIESCDMLVPSDQDCWVVVDTNTENILCVCDTGY